LCKEQAVSALTLLAGQFGNLVIRRPKEMAAGATLGPVVTLRHI
jgi:hypothetical protein